MPRRVQPRMRRRPRLPPPRPRPRRRHEPHPPHLLPHHTHHTGRPRGHMTGTRPPSPITARARIARARIARRVVLPASGRGALGRRCPGRGKQDAPGRLAVEKTQRAEHHTDRPVAPAESGPGERDQRERPLPHHLTVHEQGGDPPPALPPRLHLQAAALMDERPAAPPRPVPGNRESCESPTHTDRVSRRRPPRPTAEGRPPVDQSRPRRPDPDTFGHPMLAAPAIPPPPPPAAGSGDRHPPHT